MKKIDFLKKIFIFILCLFLTCTGIFFAEEGSGGNNNGSSTGAIEGAPEGNGGEGNSDGENGGQNPPAQNYPVNSATGAIDVAKNGGNLGGVSNEALKAGIEACGDNPENADAKAAMQNELNSRTITNAENNAIAAENAAAEAVKEYVADVQKLDNLKKEAAALYADIAKMNYEYQKNGIVSDSYEKTVESYREICSQIPAQEAKVQESRTNVEQKTTEMREAYTELAAAYNAAGDPVRLATGDYLASYVDFEAIDEITHFKVIRNLSNSGYIESFGMNWTCSLDSRIVLCKSYDYEKLLKNVEKAIEVANNSKKVLENYKNKYPSYEDERIEKYYTIIKNKLSELDQLKTLLKGYIEKSNTVEFLNHYVNYGRFKTHASIFGPYNMLIFLDEEGVARFFTINENRKWVGIDDFTKSKMEIDTRGVFDFSSDYGYLVKFADGRESYYSVNGVHVKDIDRNGNITTYETGKSNRIEKIKLCTGETITVTRNIIGNITKISGPVSGTASYSYMLNTLNSVVDNE